MELEALRKEIDEVDESLVELFKKRMKISAAVAEYKRENGLPVLDASRERALLNKISCLSGEEFEEYSRVLYATILELSRAYQHSMLNTETVIYGEILNALENTPKMFPTSATVACQGVEGAYSQIAAEKLFAHPNIVFFSNWEKTLDAIEQGMCKYAVIPIENSTAGSVNKVYDLMISRKFKIVRTARIKIDHNLLALKGVDISEIKEIVSHEQAISQCAAFLAGLGPNVKVTCVENTAKAAQMVVESGRRDLASLSSRSCAAQYGLSVLRSSVQDNGNNHTRFICITNKAEIFPGADRTSLMVVAPHRPGSLYRMLSKFNALGINLLKLESRPIPDRDFEFMFYFDLELSVYSPKLAELLAELERECEEFSYLGTYTEVV